MKKPDWVIAKEKRTRRASDQTVWLFGLHAVREALANPARSIGRLCVTPNAERKLADAIAQRGVRPDVLDPRKFDVPLDPGSTHQGAALEVKPLDWGGLEGLPAAQAGTRLVVLDRVTDPHNVGAILRSAEVFGAQAVLAPLRHAAPESGALAKAASGAMERQPYIRIKNLSDTLARLRKEAYLVVGLDGDAGETFDTPRLLQHDGPLALVFGAEGAGLRERTKANCDVMVKIPSARGFGSLNVSNAVAVALFASRPQQKERG